MFNLKNRPKTKKLDEFELLEINLIKDTPLDYAYVMIKSNRVIQKENKKSLIEIILKDHYSIEYVKLGPERDFELISSIPELSKIINRTKRKNAKSGLIINLILIIVLSGIIIFGNINKDLWGSSFFGVSISLLIFTGFHIYQLLKYK